MKKFVKLSIAASLVLGASLSADTLEDAFKNAKVKGELKAQYYVRQATDGTTDKIFVTGGNLNFVTGSYYGFQAGVTFQASHVVDRDIEGRNVFDYSMDASGAVMSESYLKYTLNNTSLKVGRQYIGTPLVAGSGSRVLKESFEGIVLANTDLPQTTLVASYVDKFQPRTNMMGDPGEFSDAADGAYTVYAKNNSVDNLTLQAQYLVVDGETANSDKNALYLEAGYDFGFMNVHAQILDTENEKQLNKKDGTLFGLKVNGNVGPVNLTGLYTTTTDDGKVFNGVGGAGDPSFTALPLHGGGVTYTPDTDTIVGVAAMNIKGVMAGLYYGEVHAGKGLPYTQIDAYGGFAQYAFTKNFSSKIAYEVAEFDVATIKDSEQLRIYTSYKF